MKIFYCLLFIITGFSTEMKSQSLWINSIPIHYHPSFAGNSSQVRLAAVGTMQKQSFSGFPSVLINQNYLSADGFLQKLHCGIGIELRYSDALSKRVDTFSIAGNYLEEKISVAPKFSHKGKYTISPSLQALHYSENDRYLISENVSAGVIHKHTNYNTCIAGILFNSTTFFAGATVGIYQNNRLSNTFLEKYPVTAIIGKTFKYINHPNISLTCVGMFRSISKISQLSTMTSLNAYSNTVPVSTDYFNRTNMNIDLWFTFKYKTLSAGANAFGPTLMAGYENDHWKIMLSGCPIKFLNAVSAQLSLRYSIRS